MRVENDEIVMSKEEWVANILNNGVAVQMLEKYTDKTKEWWMDKLGDIANQQLEILKEDRPEQIEQMINIYAEASE